MSYSKSDLKQIKKQLLKSNPQALKRKIKTASKTVARKEIKASYKKPKSVVQWNFDVNDLIELKDSSGMSGNIGLIVSDYIYHSSRVEKNNFFVLVNNAVRQIEGRYLKKVWYHTCNFEFKELQY